MTWLVILAVGAGSYVFRLGPLLVLERNPLGERADRAIRHAGTAAIAALIAVSTRHGAVGDLTGPTLLAVAAGLVLAALDASMVRLLAIGGAVYAGSDILLHLAR